MSPRLPGEKETIEMVLDDYFRLRLQGLNEDQAVERLVRALAAALQIDPDEHVAFMMPMLRGQDGVTKSLGLKPSGPGDVVRSWTRSIWNRVLAESGKTPYGFHEQLRWDEVYREVYGRGRLKAESQGLAEEGGSLPGRWPLRGGDLPEAP